MPAKILVVDDDLWIQRVVLAALRDQDYALTTASDGTVALAKAMADPPDLVISDVMMPGMSGWTLVTRVRATPRLALTPFIFLTALDSAEDKLQGFRLGADDYLPKPFRPEELAARVASVLRRSQHLHGAAREQVREVTPTSARGFNGNLEDIGVASLLVLLEMERKTGLLVLHRDHPQERCRLFLTQGRVVDAFMDVGPEARHVDTVYHALQWSAGQFEFRALPVEMRDQIGSSITALLLEGARRMDESSRDDGIELPEGDML
ncbi:response regulator [Nannocystis bainbridge]|uniref:Response regulator n=1 Tax=Nannocystis bainbridge TaxID=2995303 RepID=A0ABT5DV73_9BACT|nr:response regulator [Nannocystis bainbridge]MDC0716598.1 response regulator [Nannocystis bainbridge]